MVIARACQRLAHGHLDPKLLLAEQQRADVGADGASVAASGSSTSGCSRVGGKVADQQRADVGADGASVASGSSTDGSSLRPIGDA